jgi:hypothetical protein
MLYQPVPSKLSSPQIKAPLIRKRLLRQMKAAEGRKADHHPGLCGPGQDHPCGHLRGSVQNPFWLDQPRCRGRNSSTRHFVLERASKMVK